MSVNEVFAALLPGVAYTIVAPQKEIESARDILNVIKKACGMSVDTTLEAVASSAKAMILKNCFPKNPVTEKDLEDFKAENELVYHKCMSVNGLKALDARHKADPTNNQLRLPQKDYIKSLTQLQACLGMIAACLTGEELNECGSPVMIEDLMHCMSKFAFLREWIGANPTTFLENLVNDMINRMRAEAFLQLSCDNVRDGHCKECDNYLFWALGMRVLVIMEPLREPSCEKEVDLSRMGGSPNALMLAQGDTYPFCQLKKCAPKTLSVCQEQRGPDYKVPIQAFKQLAAELKVLILLVIKFEGEANENVFGPGPHYVICGDMTRNKVLIYWLGHNSNNVMGNPGEEVCANAVNYGEDGTPEEAQASYGALMLTVLFAAAAVTAQRV